MWWAKLSSACKIKTVRIMFLVKWDPLFTGTWLALLVFLLLKVTWLNQWLLMVGLNAQDSVQQLSTLLGILYLQQALTLYMI